MFDGLGDREMMVTGATFGVGDTDSRSHSGRDYNYVTRISCMSHQYCELVKHCQKVMHLGSENKTTNIMKYGQ